MGLGMVEKAERSDSSGATFLNTHLYHKINYEKVFITRLVEDAISLAKTLRLDVSKNRCMNHEPEKRDHFVVIVIVFSAGQTFPSRHALKI